MSVTYQLKHLSDVANRAGVSAQLERLSDAINKAVIITDPHGGNFQETYPDSTVFRVHIWAYPGEYNPKDLFRSGGIVPKIWGISTKGIIDDICFTYRGVGIDIADGNFSVAELVNKNQLFILFDLLHNKSTSTIPILARLVDEVITVVNTVVNTE